MEHTPGSVGILDREAPLPHEPVDETAADSTPGESVFLRQVRYITAVCSFAAALLHILAMIDHRGSPTLARGFLAVAAIQVVWGVLLIVDARKLFVAIGAIATAGAIGVWVLSRTKGISWFPGLDHVEALGWRDVVTQFYQLIALAGAAILLLPMSVYRAAGKKVELLPIALFSILAIAVMGVLYAATHSGGHAH